MQVWRALSEARPSAAGSVVAIGNFDGVHIGHRFLLEKAKARAATLGAQTVALTFDPHPVHVLAPARDQRLLTPMPERLRLLEKENIDAAYVLKFDRQAAAQSAE